MKRPATTNTSTVSRASPIAGWLHSAEIDAKVGTTAVSGEPVIPAISCSPSSELESRLSVLSDDPEDVLGKMSPPPDREQDTALSGPWRALSPLHGNPASAKPSPDHCLAGLDLLRGIAAVCVTVYHVHIWTAQDHRWQLGTFGVYLLFVIQSDLCFSRYSTREALTSLAEIPPFLWKACLRLLPLRTAVTMVHFLLAAYRSPGISSSDSSRLFVSCSSLLGLGNPGSAWTVCTWCWSLDIELLFYFCFPVLLALFRGASLRATVWAFFGLLALQQMFLHIILDPSLSLADQRSVYDVPLTFLPYFAAGALIAKIRACDCCSAPSSLQAAAGVGGLLMFMMFWMPSSSMQVAVGLSGVLAMGWVILCAFLSHQPVSCFSFGLGRVAAVMHQLSLGIYLWHPVVISLLRHLDVETRLFFPAATDSIVPVCVLVVGISSLLALVSHRFLQVPLQNLAFSRIQATN